MHQSYLAVQCHLLPQLHYHFLHINSTHCAAVRTSRLKATLADRRTEHWADVSRAGNKTVLPLSLLHTYAILTFLHRLITLFGYAQYCHYNAQGMCCQPNKQWTTPVIALEVSRPENGADHSPSSGHG